ncbi:MotA/TolQ/ExbB proton channel domain-containing protein [Candidatus Magnetomoraceae bacterium gMMP-15]
MVGLEAIAAHNGWAIAIVGVSIVFLGLLGLSFTISQLPRLIKLWEVRSKIFKGRKHQTLIELEPQLIRPTHGLAEAIRHFTFLTDWLGEPFSLPELIDLAEKRGIVRPYSTLNSLLLEKIIIPDGKGYFLWKSNFK